MRLQPDDIQFARRELVAYQAYQANYRPDQLATLRAVAAVIADEPHTVPPSTAALFVAIRSQHAGG